MTSRIHAILPRVAVLIGLALVAGGTVAYLRYTHPYTVPPGTDIFAFVTGRWAWTTDSSRCSTHWHDISFSPDHRVMTIANAYSFKGVDGKFDSLTVYDIQAHTDAWIRAAIRGEQRLTEDGRPVVWDLVLRAPNRYVWHRTDWVVGGYTRAIERCTVRRGAAAVP